MEKIDKRKLPLEKQRGCPACGHRSLNDVIRGLLEKYRPLFTKPSFEHFTAFMRCFMGSDQKKCVTTVFWESLSEKHFSTFYRFLSQYRWSLKALCQTTFRLLVETFALSKSVSADGKSWLIAILDETRTKKWGTKIFGTSWHFNHARQKNEGRYFFGHQWVMIGLLIETTARWVFFPLYALLYRRKEKCSIRHPFKTKIQLACQALLDLALPACIQLFLIADAFYCNKGLVDFATALGHHVVTRAKSNAVFFWPLSNKQRQKKKRGRPRKYGRRFDALHFFKQHAKTMTVEVFGKSLTIKLASKVVVSRALKRPILLVMVQFPGAPVGYLVTTALWLTAAEVVIHYCRRWKIEITFRELNQRFGAKDYMVRNKNSVPRFMNLCLLAYTLVELLSLGVIPVSQALFHAICDRPWYHRKAPSIGQMRTLIQLLASRTFGIFNAKTYLRLETKNPGDLYRRLAAQRQFPCFPKISAESLN
jgi:hypothetical protein